MKLSIVVLTYNQCDITLRLFQSLKGFMASCDNTEIILIDNGSSDKTVERIRELYSSWNNRLTIIANQSNRGVAAGRNQGLRIARGKYLMLLDNDTMVTSGAILQLIGYLDSHHRCGLVSPALVSPDGHHQANAKPFPGIVQKIRHLLRLPESASEQAHSKSEHPFYLIGACQLFRRELLDQIGFLDENIFFGPEDADFCMRVRAAGFTVDYLQSVSIIHDWQRTSHKSPFSRTSLLHTKALLYFYCKHKRIL